MRMDLSGRRLGVLALGMASLLFGHGAALAQETAPVFEDETFQQKVMKKVMGAVGIHVGGDRQIDYHERAPLVIPPNNDLPPPETAAARPAEWPNDAGQHRQKKAAAKKKNPNGDQGGGSWLPSLGDSKKFIDGVLGHPPPEATEFRGEPARAELTEPPAGYQVPSPNFPYGINNATKKASAAATAPATDGLPLPGGPPSPGAPSSVPEPTPPPVDAAATGGSSGASR